MNLSQLTTFTWMKIKMNIANLWDSSQPYENMELFLCIIMYTYVPYFPFTKGILAASKQSEKSNRWDLLIEFLRVAKLVIFFLFLTLKPLFYTNVMKLCHIRSLSWIVLTLKRKPLFPCTATTKLAFCIVVGSH